VWPEIVINVDDIITATRPTVVSKDNVVNKEVLPENATSVDGNTIARSMPQHTQPNKSFTTFHMALQGVTDEIVRPSINIPIPTILVHVQNDVTDPYLHVSSLKLYPHQWLCIYSQEVYDLNG